MNKSSSSIAPERLPPHSAVSGADLTERIDKWLWAVRVFKTRSLATDACRAGSVEVNGQPAKPARDVRSGETITVRQGLVFRTFRVLGIPKSRVGPKLVAAFSEDKTPPEEFAKARERSVQQVLAREKGSGRPTKKERRDLEQLFG
ncbi:MAG TPA: S4 domain-containing protein [Opitutaceae bacterium]|nr:S4 domain-containing protein [Opitutaceae bacterium]